MKSILKIPRIVCIALLFVGCGPTEQQTARASQLLKEIDEIAQKPVDGHDSEDLIQAMGRLYEAKKTFPSDRDKVTADAQMGRRFFTSAIEGHHRIVGLFEELLTMRLSEPDSDCVKRSIDVQRAQIERMELTLSEIDVFLDERITDKETFDARTFTIKENAKEAELKVDELTREQRSLCSKVN